MKPPTSPALRDGQRRCGWCTDDARYVAYHDLEWGVPEHDPRALFELLTLEGAQAGLSWLTVLQRRDGYRRAFADFDVDAVAGFDDERVEQILADPGVIRHRQKVRSVVTNARAILRLRTESTFGDFAEYVWSIAAGASDSFVIARAMSQRLAEDGFTFVGPTICRSFVQATGMVNDHEPDCYRHGSGGQNLTVQ